jgi:hypothetical protein
MPTEWGNPARATVRELRKAVLEQADGLTYSACQVKMGQAEEAYNAVYQAEGATSMSTAEAMVAYGCWDDICWWMAEWGKDKFIKSEWDRAGKGLWSRLKERRHSMTRRDGQRGAARQQKAIGKASKKDEQNAKDIADAKKPKPAPKITLKQRKYR